ncbi:MAG: hypothetical protein ACYDCC_09175 [Actinomycetota bacterium]
MSLFRNEARRRIRLLEQAGELRNKGDAAGAIDVLAPLLLDHSDDPAANIEMARSLSLLDDAAGAEEHYKRALKVHLAYPIVVELAGVIGAQGRSEEAEETLQAATVMAEQDSTLDIGEVHLMRAMLATGRRDRSAAEAALLELDASTHNDRLIAYGQRLRARLASLSS